MSQYPDGVNSGTAPVDGLYECSECGGDGELYTSHRSKCYACNGVGKVNGEEYNSIVAKIKAWDRL